VDNILIIRFSSLGDIILTEPIVQTLRNAYPAAGISYLTRAGYVPLLEMFRGVDRTIPWMTKTGIGELRAQLQRQRYDLIVDLHRNLRSRSLCRGLSGKKIAAGKEWLKRVARVKLKWLATSPRHAVERYFQALENPGTITQFPVPKLHVSEPSRVWKENTLRARGLNHDYYVIAAGSVHPTKRAPAELWAGVVRKLRESIVCAPLLVGSLDEQSYLLEVAQWLDLGDKSVFAEEDIRRSAAILEGAAFALANDSGLSHLSAALERPTLTLFGPTHPSLGFAPLGQWTSHYTVNEYCSPCSLHGKRRCYRQERYCFTKMEPEVIVEKLLSLITLSSEEAGGVA